MTGAATRAEELTGHSVTMETTVMVLAAGAVVGQYDTVTVGTAEESTVAVAGLVIVVTPLETVVKIVAGTIPDVDVS